MYMIYCTNCQNCNIIRIYKCSTVCSMYLQDICMYALFFNKSNQKGFVIEKLVIAIFYI